MTRAVTPFVVLAALVAVGLSTISASALAATNSPPTADARLGPSGLPLPRFVSLRADEVNMRTGPGVRYPIEWVFERKDLPVQIIAEFEAWRQIRDAEGTTGWVHSSMLSGKRTVATNGDVDRLLREPEANAPVAAWVEAGVIGDLDGCEADWCRVTVADQGVTGWIPRRGLWGVLPDETGR